MRFPHGSRKSQRNPSISLTPIFFRQLLADFGDLFFVTHHQAEMPVARIRCQAFALEDGQKLMFADLEEGVAFTPVQLRQAEDVLVEIDRCADMTDFDGDMIASENLYAHGDILASSARPNQPERGD